MAIRALKRITARGSIPRAVIPSHRHRLRDYQQIAVPLGVVAGMPVGIAALP
jgi:hypothetical protein